MDYMRVTLYAESCYYTKSKPNIIDSSLSWLSSNRRATGPVEEWSLACVMGGDRISDCCNSISPPESVVNGEGLI